jgi:hypothetical protein
MSTAHEIALNCLILGDDFSQGFVARIPEASLVADLKKSIKQEKENAFSDVDANDLRLLRSLSPRATGQLKQSLFLDSDQLLDPFDRVSEVFADGVPQKIIHILVKIPDDSKTLQQVKEQEDLLTGLANSFKIATIITSKSPSVVAEPSEYAKIQSSPQRILDCRSSARNPVNTVAPPIQLSHPAYAYLSRKTYKLCGSPLVDASSEHVTCRWGCGGRASRARRAASGGRGKKRENFVEARVICDYVPR